MYFVLTEIGISARKAGKVDTRIQPSIGYHTVHTLRTTWNSQRTRGSTQGVFNLQFYTFKATSGTRQDDNRNRLIYCKFATVVRNT